jgi:DNA-binding transcriptional ArsR family regulator
VNPEKTVNENTEHTIQDIYYLENIEQLEILSDPIRYRMYLMMAEPKTGAQLARALEISRARAHYHLNILRDAGLVMFREEKLTHGMTEKYYQAIAHYLDFSNLIPKDQQDLVPNEVTLRSFKAAIGFVATMLDSSREGLDHVEVHNGLGIGFHYILNTELTPDQFKLIKEELVAIKDRIIEMERENARSDDLPPLVNCRTTLFLTPVSDDLLETEPKDEE